MNQNEQPPKETSAFDADEVKRQRRERLERAITPPSSGYSGGRERYTPPPDYPLQPCDFKRQTQFDSLSIEQACFVLLGFEPPPLQVLKFVQDTYNLSDEPTWDEPPDYQDVLRSLRLSIKHGNVSAQRIREGRYETNRVSWPELVRWARSKSYGIAPELESIVAKIAPVDLAAPESQVAPVLPVGASGGMERVPEKPWLVANPKDPTPGQPWYTPARYFARQLVIEDSTLLTKKLVLADKVSKQLASASFFKRGRAKNKLSADTVLKAFVNVALG